MSDSYSSSDDFIRRKSSSRYRSVDDTPAMREYREYERQRKAAAAARKAAAAAPPSEEKRAA